MSMPLQVKSVIVPRKQILDILPFVESFLKDAMQYNSDWTYTDLITALLTEHCKLWVVSDKKVLAAAVTQIYTYPTKKEVRVHLLGGVDSAGWGKEWSESLERYAKAEGAKSIDLLGRKGWERALKPWGYEQVTHLRKEVL